MGSEVQFKGKFKSYMRLPFYLVILFAALDVWLYVLDMRAGLICSAFIAAYIVIVVLIHRHDKPIIMNDLIEFATQYGTVQKRLLNDFEIPYVLMDATGKLLWMNSAFSALTGKERFYHKSITAVFPEITKELMEKKDEQDIAVTWGDRYFRASVKKVYFNEILKNNNVVELEKKDQYLVVAYFHDETELKRYIQENEEMQLVSGLIYIDNYDEVIDSVEDVKQSLLIALVDRKVNKYFSNVDAIVKKTEKDKYFVVFKQKHLKALTEDKYSILEDVKTVKIGNESAITLSIGLGSGCKDYIQNYEYARTSIDLALGRGGDQVVHKTKETVHYYGGNSRQIEKHTRVKARVKALALREIMLSRDKFYVMGHAISDVDALGAAIGIFCAGRHLGKKVQIVIDEVTTSLRPIKELFSVANGYPEDMFVSSAQAIEEYDYNACVIVVDTNKPSLTECPSLLNRAKTVVVFDHHRQSTDVIKNAVLSYIEPYASSTCEMIAEVLQYFDQDVKLLPNEVDSIYAGILIDTNNFMTKTGVRTFEAAAYLRRCGADVTRVRKLLRNDMKAYKARAEAVRLAEVYKGCYAISVCPATNIESPTVACAQAANELLNIIGIKASFVLTEYNEKIYISSRSIDEINVQRIMEHLGGGGHISTAGAQLTNCSIEEAVDTIKRTLDEMIKEGEIK